MTTAAFRLAAAESTSETFAAVATTIQGNGGSGSRVTFFSLPLVQPVAYAGTVTAKESDTITDANANWTNDQFNGANGSFYVEFDSGLVADITETDGTAQTLRFPGDLQAIITVGDSFRIRKHTTISDVFGPNNEAGLVAGFNSSAADNIILLNPSTQTFLTIFFCNYPSLKGWFFGNYQPAGNIVTYPEQGIMVRRKISADLPLYLKGIAKEGPSVVPIAQGYSLLGTLRAAGSLRLADMNLYTGQATTGLAAGLNQSAADNLIRINSDGSTTTYFYCNYPGLEGWRCGNYQDGNSVVVQPGSAFYVLRKRPHGEFNWIIPAE